MSTGIEFEKMIIDHLRGLKQSTKSFAPSVPVSKRKTSFIPESTILFFGICIGTGLATHALLTNWNDQR